MEFNSILVFMTIVATFVSLLALILSIFGVYALIKIKAMESSTHSVQLMPVDSEIDKLNEEYLNQWATSEESIKKDMKKFREEMEDKMPDFAPNDEDYEKFSL